MGVGAFNSNLHKDSDKLNNRNPGYLIFGQLLNIGGIMAAGMVLFGFIGSKLDRHYGTGNTCLIIGLFIGLFMGFYETWKAVALLNKQALNKKNENRENIENKSVKKSGDFSI